MRRNNITIYFLNMVIILFMITKQTFLYRSFVYKFNYGFNHNHNNKYI